MSLNEWVDPDTDFIRADFDELRRGRLMVLSHAVNALSSSVDVLDSLGRQDFIEYQVKALEKASRSLAETLLHGDNE